MPEPPLATTEPLNAFAKLHLITELLGVAGATVELSGESVVGAELLSEVVAELPGASAVAVELPGVEELLEPALWHTALLSHCLCRS